MGEVKWTKEQEDVIHEKNKNILVSAAAGSGKTAVLVERIINKIINEKVDIDKILVVTFTNAAASEMRERILNAIYKKLDEKPEDENLQRQITLLGKASICTIDSFCLEVVRNNFYELENISPNFRIGDTTEIELLKQEVIEEIFETKYEERNEEFLELINTYTNYKDDSPLKEIVLKIYTYIQSNPFPTKWLNEKIEMFNLKEKLEDDFSNTVWGKILLKKLEEELTDGIKSLDTAREMICNNSDLEPFYRVIRNSIENLESMQQNINNWDKLYEISQTKVFVDWPKKRFDSEAKTKAKEIRDSVKKKLENEIRRILKCNSKDANQDIYDMYKVLKRLENLIIEFDEEFINKKREKNLVDFSDIEHLALEILLKENSRSS